MSTSSSANSHKGSSNPVQGKGDEPSTAFNHENAQALRERNFLTASSNDEPSLIEKMKKGSLSETPGEGKGGEDCEKEDGEAATIQHFQGLSIICFTSSPWLSLSFSLSAVRVASLAGGSRLRDIFEFDYYGNRFGLSGWQIGVVRLI